MLSSEPQLVYAGLLDLRAQAEVPSALRADTPTQLALVDVASAPNASTLTYFGVADRSMQILQGR